MNRYRAGVCAVILSAVLAGTGCGSGQTSSHHSQPVPTPKFGNVAAGSASGAISGTLAVSDVSCTTVASTHSLNLLVTGGVASELVQLSLLVQPFSGAATYDVSKGAGEGGLLITDETPPGGNWQQGSERDKVVVTTGTGSKGTFDVWGDRVGAQAVELSGSWSCKTVFAR